MVEGKSIQSNGRWVTGDKLIIIIGKLRLSGVRVHAYFSLGRYRNYS